MASTAPSAATARGVRATLLAGNVSVKLVEQELDVKKVRNPKMSRSVDWSQKSFFVKFNKVK